jgi:hypothetical protein
VVFLQEHGLAVVLQREGEVTDSDKHDHGGREQGSALPNTMYSTQILRADSHPLDDDINHCFQALVAGPG